jgi:hypothetical protein
VSAFQHPIRSPEENETEETESDEDEEPNNHLSTNVRLVPCDQLKHSVTLLDRCRDRCDVTVPNR